MRIDWSKRLVEVEGKIALREGALELLACSPRTREHESIIVVKARPMHIFQAMGLIGLEPGAPAQFDAAQEKWLAPHGEALELRIRYQHKSAERIVPAEDWLLSAKSGRRPKKIHWVFAGSATDKDGRFGADAEGTVVCVVDFQTALIAVGDLHSADNELLWLRANKDAIPPRDTKCSLLIGRAGASEETGKTEVGRKRDTVPQENAKSRQVVPENPGG